MKNNILFKIYSMIFPILAVIFAFIGMILFNMALASYAPLGIDFSTVLWWCEDTVMNFNNNVYAIVHVTFLIVIFIIALLSSLVYVIVAIKNKKYISLAHLAGAVFALFNGIACMAYFFFSDFNMNNYPGVGLIDVDYCALVLSLIGVAFAIITFIFVSFDIFKRNENKFEPVIIRKY